VGAPAPGWQGTVWAFTSRKMRVGAPYRLCGVRCPLKLSTCLAADSSRSTGASPGCTRACSGCVSSADICRSAFISGVSHAFIVPAS